MSKYRGKIWIVKCEDEDGTYVFIKEPQWSRCGWWEESCFVTWGCSGGVEEWLGMEFPSWPELVEFNLKTGKVECIWVPNE